MERAQPASVTAGLPVTFVAVDPAGEAVGGVGLIPWEPQELPELAGRGPWVVGMIAGSVARSARWSKEVTEADLPRRWAVRGVSGPIRPSASIVVEPLDGGARSRVTFTLEFEGHGIGVPLVPAIRAMAAKGAPLSYRNLKQRLESGRKLRGGPYP